MKRKHLCLVHRKPIRENRRLWTAYIKNGRVKYTEAHLYTKFLPVTSLISKPVQNFSMSNNCPKEVDRITLGFHISNAANRPTYKCVSVREAGGGGMLIHHVARNLHACNYCNHRVVCTVHCTHTPGQNRLKLQTPHPFCPHEGRENGEFWLSRGFFLDFMGMGFAVSFYSGEDSRVQLCVKFGDHFLYSLV